MAREGLPLQELVKKLTREGIRSEYLERLKRRVDIEQAHDDLRREIAREMAQALGRTEEKLNRALLELELLDGALGRASTEARPALVERYNEARQLAISRRRDLEIHREAVGLRRPRGFSEMYPIPPRAR